MDKMELVFKAEKRTRRTVRFQEIPGDRSWGGEELAIGPLYVKKQALELIGNPDKIKVTVEPA